MPKQKIFIIPGNGDAHIEKDHWYSWVRDELQRLGYSVIAKDMPDPVIGHNTIWLPYIKNELHADENTVIIGHSSGGVAALRYLETDRLFGAIIIGVNHTDLGYEEEKESGYYSDTWKWKNIRQNARWIVQFASQDDPYISITEPRFIHEQLCSEYHEYTDMGHFGPGKKGLSKFPQLVEVIHRKLG